MSKPSLRLLVTGAVALVAAAGLFAVPASADTTPNPDPCVVEPGDICPGAVSGHLTDAGAPVEGATAVLVLASFQAEVARTVTDADGAFRFADVRPNGYKVRFDFPGGLVQFYPQKTTFAAGTLLTVTEGNEEVIADSALPHGSLAGHISTSHGGPAAKAFVGLIRSDGILVGQVPADDNGDYIFGFVTAGSYVVFVQAAPVGAPRQWVPGKKTRAEAQSFTVTLGARTTVDEQLLPLGKISGTFSGPDGPIFAISVLAKSMTSSFESVFISTGRDGTFSMFVYPGRYKVRFEPTPPDLEQWANGKDTENLADVITVAADAEIVLDEHLLPTGRVQGRLTDASGAPVAFGGVLVSDPARDRNYQQTTDEDGNWFVTARPGTYSVLVDNGQGTQEQFFHGKTTAATADPITVQAGQTTVVDEAFLPPGSLTVTATDAKTGAALTTFCVDAANDIAFLIACTDDGSAEFATIGEGTYTVTVQDDAHLDSVNPGVQVTRGRPTTFAAKMTPGATFAVTLVDSATGAPVTSSCINAVPAEHARDIGPMPGSCTDENGTLSMTKVPPDKYVIFASVFDGEHGAQWVGPHGGVGAQTEAKVYTAKAGVTINVTIKVDKAGTIAGVLTDKATGAPIVNEPVVVWGAGTSTEADGHYTFTGLGPYAWPVFFGGQNYAGVWSGGVNDRFAATPIKVRVGRTTTYDVKLRKGTTLTGRVSGPFGQAPTSATVQVIDASSFDTLAVATPDIDGVYTAHVLGPQNVKLLVDAQFPEHNFTQWYSHATDFAHGRLVGIPSNGTKTVDIPLR
jgi:hypothetical protein